MQTMEAAAKGVKETAEGIGEGAMHGVSVATGASAITTTTTTTDPGACAVEERTMLEAAKENIAGAGERARSMAGYGAERLAEGVSSVKGAVWEPGKARAGESMEKGGEGIRETGQSMKQ